LVGSVAVLASALVWIHLLLFSLTVKAKITKQQKQLTPLPWTSRMKIPISPIETSSLIFKTSKAIKNRW
jgi:hypothetical protein